MPKFTAVMGKSKTNRVISVGAATEELARTEMIRQLSTNPQRREILAQWQTSGATIIEEDRSPAPAFNEAEANALIRGRLAELLGELSAWNTSKDWGTLTVPRAMFQAYCRAKDALEAYDQGIVA